MTRASLMRMNLPALRRQAREANVPDYLRHPKNSKAQWVNLILFYAPKKNGPASN